MLNQKQLPQLLRLLGFKKQLMLSLLVLGLESSLDFLNLLFFVTATPFRQESVLLNKLAKGNLFAKALLSHSYCL